MDDASPTKVDDGNCDPAKRYENSTECHVTPDECKGAWFSGPWSECSKTCGTERRPRPILCLDNVTVKIDQCGTDTIPSSEEKCNTQACSDETTPDTMIEMPLVEVCEAVEVDDEEASSASGEEGSSASGEEENIGEEVIEDKIVESSGSNLGMEPSSGSGSSSMENKLETMKDNMESSSDNPAVDMLAKGSWDAGSQSSGLGLVLRGMTNRKVCRADDEDKHLPEIGKKKELLLSSEGSGSGMGLTPGSGLGFGIILGESGSYIDGMDSNELEVEEEMSVIDTKNGLLQSENVLPVTGSPEYETCEDAEFKCFPDGITPAKGANNEGCFTDACKTQFFGCCPDGFTPCEGNDNEVCPEPTTLPPPTTISSMEEDFMMAFCKQSAFGCCPNQLTPTTGTDNQGCFQCESSGMEECGSGSGSGAGPECNSCDDTKFGCCPGNLRETKGLNGEGCEAIKNGFGEVGSGDVVPTTKSVINCAETEFGCCPHSKIAATGPDSAGFDTPCAQTKFGCCDDNVTSQRLPSPYQPSVCMTVILKKIV